MHEQFTGMTLSNCGAWATTSGAVMAMGGSPLILMTVGAAATECTSKTIGSGAFINVATIPMTPGDTLFLTATLDSSQEITLQLRVGASALIFELLGPNTTISANYSMSNTWWRLSSEGPSALVGESSTDGVTWAKLGTQPTGNSPSDELRMKFGLRTGASGGSGAIADYDQCQ